jgi:nucleoside-diphosphate-sugar epimerase
MAAGRAGCRSATLTRARPPARLPPPPWLQGKLNTEEMLAKSGVNWTSIRPVYIYGPLNYNPVEEWFFHRIAAGRPVPVPGSGMQVGAWQAASNAVLGLSGGGGGA